MGSNSRGGGGGGRSSNSRSKQQRWSTVQTLTPLMEGPDSEMKEDEYYYYKKESSNWEIIREWFRLQNHHHHKGFSNSNSSSAKITPFGANNKGQDLRHLLGVLGCPLAPIPLLNFTHYPLQPNLHHIKDIPLENCMAHYIIQQYLAATGCLKAAGEKKNKNMYATGSVKMIRCETEISTGKNVKSLGTRSGENGCFVVWQMLPGMWSLELVVGGNKVIAGSDGKTVWRHTPWFGTHVAKGPQRPLRRLIQGLDPKSTASLFTKAQCLGEKRIGEDECFVLKVAADKEAVMERSEGSAEVLRHVLYGYFCQKTGLLIYLEDSHLTRVHTPDHHQNDITIYWETTIGSSIGDYRDVDGTLIAHQGRSIATVFRFEEESVQHSRTRMEEIWRIDDVVFNVPGLDFDSFIPPADIFDAHISP